MTPTVQQQQQPKVEQGTFMVFTSTQRTIRIWSVFVFLLGLWLGYVLGKVTQWLESN